MKLDLQRLEVALLLVGELLSDSGKDSFHLVVCGGSALLATGVITRATVDVDVFAQRNFDGEISQIYPLPEALHKIARQVADELNLDPNWLNGSASFHFPDFHAFPQSFWSDIEAKDYGNHLRVGFVGRSGQILLKLYAALNRAETRDLEDLGALAPDLNEVKEGLSWVLRSLSGLSHRDRISDLLTHLGYEELIGKFTR